MRLQRILKEIESERQDKTVLNSSPDTKEIQRFHEISEKVMKVLKHTRSVEKEQLHTEEVGSSLFSTNMVRKSTLTQHLGIYEGEDLKGFMQKIAEAFQKAGFKVIQGYGIDNIKGYEVLDSNKEVVGEIDFLEKKSIPGLGNTIILKHKKI